MSERRTAEIKFRCTPSFKADAQADADAAGQSLTEYIEASVRARRNVRAANEVVDGAIEMLRERGAGESAAVAKLQRSKCCAGHPVNAGTACDDCPATSEKDGGAILESLEPLRANNCGCKPWAFCSCKAKADA